MDKQWPIRVEHCPVPYFGGEVYLVGINNIPPLFDEAVCFKAFRGIEFLGYGFTVRFKQWH